jgi:GTP-binding protein LepA
VDAHVVHRLHKDNAYPEGAKAYVEKLRDNIPRQLFEVPVQAAMGGKDHRARDRQGHAQGRARQMLRRRYNPQRRSSSRKQKEGKKRMRQFGSVEIPHEAFMAVLKLD